MHQKISAIFKSKQIQNTFSIHNAVHCQSYYYETVLLISTRIISKILGKNGDLIRRIAKTEDSRCL